MSRQRNQNADSYSSEIEDLTKRLEYAYISDGLPIKVESTFATAVKAVVKNATNEMVTLIMESGNFSTRNGVMAKFVNSFAGVFGQPNSVLFYVSNNRGNGANRRQFLGSIYINNNMRNNSINNNNRYHSGGNSYRGRSRNSYGTCLQS